MEPQDLISVAMKLVIYGPLLLLPAIPAWRARSWRIFLLGLPKVLLGVYVPLWVFVFSAALAPEWKGAAQLGWVSCFCVGKLVLLPLVLWALASFYAVEVCQVTNRQRPWIVLGYFQGAIVSGVCLLSGYDWLFRPYERIVWWLAVPGCVTGYFTWRAAQLVRESQTSDWTLFKSWTAGIPLWAGAIYLSWKTYTQLPDEAPQGCFVVTAASRGHAAVVGPFEVHERNGVVRRANRQLLTFWAFEARWQTRAPQSHRAFRRVYNVLGRRFARCLRNRWLADAAYLALKPVEWLAARALNRR